MEIKQIKKDYEDRPKRLLRGSILYNDEENNVRRNRRKEIIQMFDEAFADEIREMNARVEYEKKLLREFYAPPDIESQERKKRIEFLLILAMIILIVLIPTLTLYILAVFALIFIIRD